VADLDAAAALPDRQAEWRRRVAEPDLDFREFCRRSKLPQSERSWDLFAAERYLRGETDIHQTIVRGHSPGQGCFRRSWWNTCRLRTNVTLSRVIHTIAVMRTDMLTEPDGTAEMVLLTGRCGRRGHSMYRVLNTRGGLVVDAPLGAIGRKQRTWTPQRRELIDGSAARYGCRCGRTSLVPDAALLAGIRRGDPIILETAYTI
jgi:hypothetical protein